MKKVCFFIFFGILYQTLVFAQTDEWIYKLYSDLNIGKETIVEEFVVIERFPLDTNFLLCVFPLKVEEEEGFWTADIHLLKIYAKSKEILIHSILEKAIISDAVSLYKISIDSTIYNIKKDKNAFAILLSYANNSRAAGFEDVRFSLIEETENGLSLIFTEEIYRGLSYGGGECKYTEEYRLNSVIFIDRKHSNNDYFNLIENGCDEHYFLTEDCKDGKKQVKKFKNTYQYIDGKYACKGIRKSGF